MQLPLSPRRAVLPVRVVAATTPAGSPAISPGRARLSGRPHHGQLSRCGASTAGRAAGVATFPVTSGFSYSLAGTTATWRPSDSESRAGLLPGNSSARSQTGGIPVQANTTARGGSAPASQSICEKGVRHSTTSARERDHTGGGEVVVQPVAPATPIVRAPQPTEIYPEEMEMSKHPHPDETAIFDIGLARRKIVALFGRDGSIDRDERNALTLLEGAHTQLGTSYRRRRAVDAWLRNGNTDHTQRLARSADIVFVEGGAQTAIVSTLALTPDTQQHRRECTPDDAA